MTYSPSSSLSVTISLFHNEILTDQVLNKIICSLMKNFNATLTFSIYNKHFHVYGVC
jgi:hypothetical protein